MDVGSHSVRALTRIASSTTVNRLQLSTCCIEHLSFSSRNARPTQSFRQSSSSTTSQTTATAKNAPRKSARRKTTESSTTNLNRNVPTVGEANAAVDAGRTEEQPGSNKPYVPKFLNRPLGVTTNPSSDRRTFSMRERMDENRHERKRLLKEMTTGYFQDFHEMKDHGGKLWLAPDTLIRQDRALFFPDFKGRTLSAKSEQKHLCDMLPDKVSLVTLGSNLISQEHISTYKDPIAEKFAHEPSFQLVQINLLENSLKYFFMAMFISSLKKSVPEKYHSTYLVSQGEISSFRESLNTLNKHVGYVYLVDWEGKIRWAACGFAAGGEDTPSKSVPSEQNSSSSSTKKVHGEVESLADCVTILLARLNERRSKSEEK